MSSVDWQRVKGVFHEVLERDGEARAALLARLRREDPGLHSDVSSAPRSTRRRRTFRGSAGCRSLA